MRSKIRYIEGGPWPDLKKAISIGDVNEAVVPCLELTNDSRGLVDFSESAKHVGRAVASLPYA